MASINPFLPIQEGTGTPSPENVRPIKPAVSIAGGKNLLKIDSNLKRGNQSFLNLELTDTGIIIGDSSINGGFLVQVKPNMTYTFSFDSEYYGGSLHIRIWKEDIKTNTITFIINLTNTRIATFTTDSETEYIRCGFYAYGIGLNQTISNMQLEEGSTKTSYEPYQTLDIYGGYLDIANSKIVKEYIVHKGGWTLYDSTNGYGKYELKDIPLGDTDSMQDMSNIISTYSVVQTTPTGNRIQTVSQGSQYVRAYMSLDENYSSDDVQYGYKLAIPVTHYLSPTQLEQAMEQLGIKLSSTLIDIRRKILLNSPHLETISDSIASFKTDVKAPLKECKIHFLPMQSGSGDPSPTNIRPITGWTEVNTEHSGKNVAHIVGYSAITPTSPTSTRYITNNYGTTINTTNSERSVTITQTNYSTSPINDFGNGYFLIIDDNLKFGERYNIAFTVDIIENPRDAVLSNMTLYSPGGSGFYGEINVNGNRVVFKNFLYSAKKDRLSIHGIDVRICGMSMTISDICITPASETDYSYEPYQSTQIPVSFGDNGTIYGGYVDLISGELVAEYACETDNGRDWQNVSTDGSYKNVWQWGHSKANITSNYTECLCTHWKNMRFANENFCGITSGNSFRMGLEFWEAVGIVPTNENIKAYFKAQADAGTPLYACAPLETPIIYQLTPQQLKSLKGINNIWSDANDVTEIKYWKH